MIDPVQNYFDEIVLPISKLTGFSLDILKQILNLVFLFVLSFIWGLVKKPVFRHLLSFIFGLFLLNFDYGLYPSLLYLFVSSTSYIFILKRLHPFITMAYSWVLSFIILIYYTVTAYGVWQMDVSTSVMLLVQKVTSLAWNLSDYKILHKKENTDDESESDKSKKSGNVGLVLSPHLQRSALKDVPSFFHYTAFVFFPVNLNVGPTIDYMQYKEGVEQSQKPDPQNRLRLYFINVLKSFFFLIYWLWPCSLDFVKDKKYYDMSEIKEGQTVGIDYFKWNKKYPWFVRILMIEIPVHWSRFKYYCPWNFSNSFLIFMGFCFEDGNWESATCVLVERVEFATTLHDFVEGWNGGTQRWLRRYIYIRGWKDKKTGKIHSSMLFVTFFFSAIWHGIYPGFYVHFLFIFGMIYLERYYTSAFPPPPSPRPKYGETEKCKEERILKEAAKGIDEKRKKTIGEKVRMVVEMIFVQLTADFAATAFLCLSLKNVRTVYAFEGYWGFFFMLGFGIIIIPLSLLRKKPTKKKVGDEKPKENLNTS